MQTIEAIQDQNDWEYLPSLLPAMFKIFKLEFCPSELITSPLTTGTQLINVSY